MRDPREELVKIEPSGVARPLGIVSSQRMRARVGVYRMLPAPAHVVFMRYTAEDGRRDAEDGAVVRLCGEITALGTMTDVLGLVAQSGWRGELVVLDGEHTRSIFCERGLVVGALTSVPEERLGMVLFRHGAITREQHETLLERLAWGQRLGEAAVQTGMLTQEQVYEYIRKQMAEVVHAVLMSSDGTFFFLDGFDEGRLVAHHAVSIQSLLMEAVTRLDEMRYFREKIPSAQHVPTKVEGAGQPASELERVYSLIDGRRSIEELGRLAGLDEFEVTKAVFQLLQSKQVVVQRPRASGGLEEIVATANQALRTIFEALRESGQSETVRESLGSFAVGAGLYELVFRGAGPDQAGLFDPVVVARNAATITGADPEQVLRQLLHEYTSFALFSAGAVLGPQREAALGREVGSVIARLRPQT